MANHNVVHSHLHSALGVLQSHNFAELCQQFSIPPLDAEKLVQTSLWTPADRPIVRRAFDAVLFGSCDTVGIPRFELPAEYIACWISLAIGPVNRMTACSWFSGLRSAQELASDPEESSFDPNIKPQQLFALVGNACGSYTEGQIVEFRSQVASSIQMAITRQQKIKK